MIQRESFQSCKKIKCAFIEGVRRQLGRIIKNTVKPPIKDTPKEDNPRQAESTHLVHTL